MGIFDKAEQKGLDKTGQTAGQYGDQNNQGAQAAQPYVARQGGDPAQERDQDQDQDGDSDHSRSGYDDRSGYGLDRSRYGLDPSGYDDQSGYDDPGQRGGYDDEGRGY